MVEFQANFHPLDLTATSRQDFPFLAIGHSKSCNSRKGLVWPFSFSAQLQHKSKFAYHLNLTVWREN